MTREQFLDLDDWALINVYFRPNENSDPLEGYWPQERQGSDRETIAVGPKESFFYVWRKRGMAEEEIEARYKKWCGE